MMNSQKGQSLWEVIIALAIASLVAVGLIRSTSTAVKTTRFSGDQTEATALAQKTMSGIVDSRHTNPSGFWTDVQNERIYTDKIESSVYCIKSRLNDVSSDIPASAPNPASAKMAKISVDVYWEEIGSGTQCLSKDYRYVLNFVTYVSN